MNKIVLLSLIGFLSFSGIKAQSLHLENATKEGFTGIRKMGNDGYYVQFIESLKLKKDGKTLRIVLINNNLEKVGDFTMTMNLNENVESIAYNGGNFMIITKNNNKRYREFKILNKEGDELASKMFEKIKARLLARDISIIPIDAADFMVINFIKDDQIGYNLERFNSKLELKYSESNIPEKRSLLPIDYEVSGSLLYVLDNMTLLNTNGSTSDFFQYSISAFDIASGKKMFRTILNDEKSKVFGVATFLRVTENGDAISGGMYFTRNNLQESNSDGFFGAIVDREGNLRIGHRDWKDVKDLIDDEGLNAMWGGKTKTFLHDVVVYEDGTFSIVGENFRRGDADLAGDKNKVMGSFNKFSKMAGSSDAEKEIAVTVADYVIFDFDVNSKFQTLRYVKRPSVITLIKNSKDEDDKPFVGQARGLNLARILNNYGYFPYQFTIGKSGQKYLTSYMNYQYDGSEYMEFMNIKTGEPAGDRVDISSYMTKYGKQFQEDLINKLPKILRNAARKEYETYDNSFELRGSHEYSDLSNKRAISRISPANIEGKVLIYDFEPSEEDMADDEKKKSWISNMSAASNGNFKLWYIDVPE